MSENMEYARTGSIISIGDLVADIVVKMPALPINPGDFQIADQINIEPGGSANFLITATRLGAGTSALGALGNDNWGRQVMDILGREGVDLSNVVVQGTTTIAMVLVDQTAEHAFVGKFGEGDELILDEGRRGLVTRADALFSSGYSLREERLSALTLEAFQCAHEAGVLCVFDPGPAFAELSTDLARAILDVVDILMLTEEEIPTVLSGTLSDILDLSLQAVVVKRGRQGCSVYPRDDEEIIQSGLMVQVRDTTAAGDSFDAGFVFGVIRGWSLGDCACLANAVGAAKVQKLGGGRNVPTLSEVQAIIDEFKLDIRL